MIDQVPGAVILNWQNKTVTDLLLVLAPVEHVDDGGVEGGDLVPLEVEHPARGEHCPAHTPG